MRRFKAIILLFVFSGTLLGFNLEGHYCDGELTDISLVGKSNCQGECASHDLVHEEEQHDHDSHENKSCASEDDCKKACEEDEEGDCCKTEKLSDLSQLEYSVELSYVQPLVFISTLLDYKLFDEETVPAQTAWEFYKDPVPDEDVQILHQSFLI